MKNNFSFKSTNLWTFVLSFIFLALSGAGVEFNANPSDLANEIVISLSTTGWIGAIGLIVTNAVNIIYHLFFKPNPDGTPWWAFFSSTNFLFQFLNFLNGLALMLMPGLEIPADAFAGILDVILAKDWNQLVLLMITNIVLPLSRWFKDRSAKVIMMWEKQNGVKRVA